MNWNQLLSGKRFGMEEYHERKHERTDFQRDYDRLIFSSPFRRLQNKTQVFPLPGSIFVHNRLTHSLEVSCVGRSLGNNVAKGLMLKYPDGSVNFPEIGSIVSAACLAHDMGNRHSDIQENGRSPLTLLKVTEKSYRKRFSTKEGAMKTFFISKGMRTPCVCSPTSSSGAAKGALP
jgi:hypothetical protein